MFHNHSTLLTMLKGSFEVVHRFVDRSTCFTWMDLNHVINNIHGWKKWLTYAVSEVVSNITHSYWSIVMWHHWIAQVNFAPNRYEKCFKMASLTRKKKIKGLLESLVKVKLRTIDHFIVVDETYHNICRWWKQKWRRCRDREVLCV